MLRPSRQSPGEKVSVLLPLLLDALQRKEEIDGEEACRLLLKLEKVPAAIARPLLEAALGGDGRFLLTDEGSIRLRATPASRRWRLDEAAYTVLDLETTGGAAASDRIVEVGAVRVEGGRLSREFATLVHPGIPIPVFIASMTGICDAMVADAPRFPAIAESFLEFLGDSVLVAHNLPFDRGFLNRELARCLDWRISNEALCTVRLGRRLLPQLADRRLDTVADYYGIPIQNRHRALGDARATARILVRFLEALRGRGIRHNDELEGFLAEEGKRSAGRRRLSARRRSPDPKTSRANAES